ncbi:MAG: C40 family peptidase [Bacteroidia bacterium]|nr:C40 family peptidase [Bacteroidia bacterium]
MIASCGRERYSSSSVLAQQQKLRDKYSVLLQVEPVAIHDFTLYKFTDHWIGVPYKYGGKDEGGIDCSGFVSRLQKEVYGREVNGPSWSIADNCIRIQRSELREGDLVFFSIGSAKISHTGVYLQNNFFIHASTSKGVMISSLTENYYMKYFHSAGRPR